MESEKKPPGLSWPLKLSYGIGHVFNDLCASMWFSYLLVFLEKVLLFSPSTSGILLLVGQLADGFSTPIVGIFSDKENKISLCARYGRRKIWHLLGTFCVLLSFPFIFSQCFGCSSSDRIIQIVYYCFFIIVFQFGWASVQISHLALIPDLTSKKHQRTELNSIRYAFTVLSNLVVYAVAFAFLSKSEGKGTQVMKCDPNNNSSSNCMHNSTSGEVVEIMDLSDNSISPDDSSAFRNLAIFCICAGTFFSALFHMGVKEPEFKNSKDKKGEQAKQEQSHTPEHTPMKKLDWFKQIPFYQVAILYMATRLYVNLYQVYMPLYVQDTLKLDKTAIATIPFAMYLAGFASSLVMKRVNKKIGRKATYAIGCVFGLIGSIWVYFGESSSFEQWGVYIVAIFLGVGGSIVLITCLSITADLIGGNVEGGAFVYGFMSFVDKISNGVIIMLIQNAYQDDNVFYKNVITFACGSACALGILITITLIPMKVGMRRGVTASIAALVSEEEEPEEANEPQKTNQPQIYTIAKGGQDLEGQFTRL